ncbi:MAG: hypothetical protein PHF19_06625 [Synergistales bacterium]|nr:hypothetical protein [Synergistales bacterium]
MLSAYSAVNQGHRHPRIIQALRSAAGDFSSESSFTSRPARPASTRRP